MKNFHDTTPTNNTTPVEEWERDFRERFIKRVDPSGTGIMSMWESAQDPEDAVNFIRSELTLREERAREELLSTLTRRMKIAQIIKPTDRSGLLIHIDDETLDETSSVCLIDGKLLDELHPRSSGNNK